MWNLPEHDLPSREQINIGMSSILAWGKSRVGLPPPFIARITKQPHCGHKWPQWPRSTDWSEADDDITTCNFALKCLIPKLLRVTVLLRHYAITARYFTRLSYWHQSYCKRKCFFRITLWRYYGKVLHSSYWHQSNCKCKCFILITLLRYYLQGTSFFFLFSIKRLWFPSYGSFCKRRSRWQPFVSVFVVSFRFWTCFIS